MATVIAKLSVDELVARNIASYYNAKFNTSLLPPADWYRYAQWVNSSFKFFGVRRCVWMKMGTLYHDTLGRQAQWSCLVPPKHTTDGASG